MHVQEALYTSAHLHRTGSARYACAGREAARLPSASMHARVPNVQPGTFSQAPKARSRFHDPA